MRTVRNVQVRIVNCFALGEAPPLAVDTECPLELQGGTTASGRDISPGQRIYAQVLTVRRVAGEDLPEVRVNYALRLLAERYAPLPRGEWLLKIQAIGDDSPAAECDCILDVSEDADPRRRVIVKMLGLTDDEDEG